MLMLISNANLFKLSNTNLNTSNVNVNRYAKEVILADSAFKYIQC